MIKSLTVIRHGESIGNLIDANARAQEPESTLRFPLTERGRNQASATGEVLRARGVTFDAHLVSHYERARETASLVFPGITFREDARIGEAQRGIWNTMTDDEVRAIYPREFARREKEGWYHYRPIGGENWTDIEVRIHSLLETLHRECADQDVVVVSHAAWLHCLERVLIGTPIDRLIDDYVNGPGYANASLTTYVRSKRRLTLQTKNRVLWSQ